MAVIEFIISHLHWLAGAAGVLGAGLAILLRRKTPPLPSSNQTSVADTLKEHAEDEDRTAERAKKEVIARVKIERERVELTTKPTPTTDDAEKLMKEIEKLKKDNS